MKKRLLPIYFLGLCGLFVFGLAKAAAVVENIGNQSVRINRTFEITKPSENWDIDVAQTTDTPVGMSLHKPGPNPNILVRLDYSPRGTTLMDYANNVKSTLSLRGVKFDEVVEKTVNNAESVWMRGAESGGNNRWLVAVFRSKGVGYVVECTVAPKEFSKYVGDFMTAINSVRISQN